jgi:hypothetical protein
MKKKYEKIGWGKRSLELKLLDQKLKFKRSFSPIFSISILSSKCYVISTCFALPDPKANAQ